MLTRGKILRLPSKSVRLHLSDIWVDHVNEPPTWKEEHWTRSVVELTLTSFGQWVPTADWSSLQKLSLHAMDGTEASPLFITLPNLREASIIFYPKDNSLHSSLDYKSFASLIFDCKYLEILKFQFHVTANRIFDFDEEDFNRRLKKVQQFRLKSLTLLGATCDLYG